MTIQTSQKAQNEMRNTTRVAIDAKAFISFNGKTFSANVKDVSGNGVRLTTGAVIPMWENAEVTIVRGGQTTSFYGRVSRVTATDLVFTKRARTQQLASLALSAI